MRPGIAVPAQVIEGEILAQSRVVLPDQGKVAAAALFAVPVAEQSTQIEGPALLDAKGGAEFTQVVGMLGRCDGGGIVGVDHQSLATASRASMIAGGG